MTEQWLEDLYGDAEQWQLKKEYFELSLADLTDDVDCSPSTLKTRNDGLCYLAKRIGEDVAIAIDDLVFLVAEIVGCASGAPWYDEQGQAES